MIDLTFDNTDDIELKVENLKKWFPVRKGLTDIFGERRYVHAVDGIDLEIRKKEIFGFVGESGCGKTTAGKTILRLIEPSAGKIYFKGQDITKINRKDLRRLRSQMQIVFQDPYSSLNPVMKVRQLVEEPLRVHCKEMTREERQQKVEAVLKFVELVPADDYLDAFPSELSGGQRQRVAIARAMVCQPEFVVLDEPVSMLDVSIRHGILILMKRLCIEHGLTQLFISHDLALSTSVCGRIAVLYLGKIVEISEPKELISNPLHPYTRALISAIPIPDPMAKRVELSVQTEVPNAINIPSGCRFRTRCLEAKTICKENEPNLIQINNDHYVSCHMIKA